MEYLSDGCLELTGYDVWDIIDNRKISYNDVIHPDYRDYLHEQWSHTLANHGILVLEYPIITKGGQIKWVWEKGSGVYSESGEVVALEGFITDITERRTAEQLIRESESRLRYLLGFYEMVYLPEKELLTYALEGAGVITGSPLGYLAFLNDDETELSMYAWSKTAMEECALRDKPIVYRVEKTGLWGEAVRQRGPVITNNYAAPNPQKKGYPEGHPQIIRHINVPILDDDQIVIVAGVANKPLDYTETDVRQLTLLIQGLWQVLKRRRIEEELYSQQEQLTEVAEMVPGVIYQFYIRPDGEKGAYYISSRVEEVFGISSSTEGFFDRFTEHVDPRDHDAFLQSIEEVAKSGQPWHYEGRFIRPSGEEIWFQGMSRPIQRGSELVFNGILLDITNQKEVDDALHERIKEISCLYRISDVIGESDRPYDEVMHTIAEIIPGGFRHPEVTAASIRINEKEYATPGYQLTPWSIHANILIHQEPVGSITICLIRNDKILPEEEKLIESIAMQIGRYIERIRSVEELYQKNVERTAAQESLHIANKKLQLLSSITRHDILNKIMALEGFLNFAEEMCVDSKQSGYLNEVRNIIGAIQGQIEFTRMYEDVGVKQPVWQQLQTVFAILEKEQVQVHDKCKVISIYADPMLEKVFYNLHDNTIRYAEGASRIALSCEEREGELIIIWEDSGPGVPDNQKELIFERGFGKNTGFGLFLAREILGITGIIIRETGIYGRGARFEISVPTGAWKSGIM